MASLSRRTTSGSCNWPRARWRRACACWPLAASKSSISRARSATISARRAHAPSDCCLRTCRWSRWATADRKSTRPLFRSMLAAGGVEKLDLAGAFGNYIRQASARAIGLLPEDLPVEPVGNSALRGARMLLLAPSTRRARLRKIAALSRHVELAADPDFQYLYAEIDRKS